MQKSRAREHIRELFDNKRVCRGLVDPAETVAGAREERVEAEPEMREELPRIDVVLRQPVTRRDERRRCRRRA